MNCSGRVYKGDLVIVTIPFDVSGYTDLSVSYFTIGDTKIVRDESGLTIEDGFITSYFEGHDLDLLPDGVLRFTLQYKVDDVDFVDSSNTMLYLKTPASYDSITPEDIYQSGYTAGFDDCGEGDCSEIQNIAYNSGYTAGYDSGYTQGQDDCPLDCESAYESGYTEGYQGGYGVGYQGGITKGMADQRALLGSQTFTSNQTATNPNGWSSVTVNVPHNVRLGTLVQTPLPSQLNSAGQWVEEFQSGGPNDGWGKVQLSMGQMINYGKEQQKALLSSTAITDNGTYTREDGWSSVNVQIRAKCPKLLGSFSSDTSVHGYDIIDTTESIGFQDFIFHVDNVAIGGITEEIPAGEHTVEVYAMNETDVIAVSNYQYFRVLKSMTY